ncbi:MAG: thioredoxin domain-containing protein, partial [Acidimicrobiales bacterium]
SFEDEAVARLVNENFIPVKVDREERPDVDAVYMAATQLISGHGGWPMSVFLLPDGRPFMAGTYYPPVDRGGQVGFTRLLVSLLEAWRNQRDVIEDQARELSNALSREVRFVDQLAPYEEFIDLRGVRRRLRDELVGLVDDEGGFGSAPKFPRPSYVASLLEMSDQSSRRAVIATLDAMSRRGLYDHFGGGFARYSVDSQWHVPHFEKMLSDQALLARCYFDASLVEPDREWREVALETIQFVVDNLRVGEGYASSLDADADGAEGSHVTWTFDEVHEVLREAHQESHLEKVAARWCIERHGTFEGTSVPRLGEGEPFVTPEILRESRRALLRRRARRVQPHRDDKIVLEWNAMMASAFLRSHEDELITLGKDLLLALERTHFDGDLWWRTQYQSAHATALDVAWWADALIDAFEQTGSDVWLEKCVRAIRYLLEHYWDGDVPTVAQPHVGAGFFSQSDYAHALIERPKDIFDGATPSSHAVATRALARLALCRGDNEFLVIAQRLVELAGSLIESHPSAVVDLVDAAGFALEGVEIVIPGDGGTLAHHVRSRVMKHAVLITGVGNSALLRDRREGLAYVCRAGVCQRPVASVAALQTQLDEVAATWRS